MARNGYSSITVDEETINNLSKIQKKLNLNSEPETIREIIKIQQGGSVMEEINNKFVMLLELVDSDRNPFLYMMLEIGATKQQIEAVYDLMDKTEKVIGERKKISHPEFEREIYRIFPKRYGHYHHAEGIVGTLGKQGRWILVYQYMKKNGMNASNM